jgi:hypothetical protein
VNDSGSTEIGDNGSLFRRCIRFSCSFSIVSDVDLFARIDPGERSSATTRQNSFTQRYIDSYILLVPSRSKWILSTVTG